MAKSAPLRRDGVQGAMAQNASPRLSVHVPQREVPRLDLMGIPSAPTARSEALASVRSDRSDSPSTRVTSARSDATATVRVGSPFASPLPSPHASPLNLVRSHTIGSSTDRGPLWTHRGQPGPTRETGMPKQHEASPERLRPATVLPPETPLMVCCTIMHAPLHPRKSQKDN